MHWPLLRMCPAVLPDVVSRELLGCRLKKLSVSAVQLYAAVEPRLKLLFLGEFIWQHGLPHLGGRQSRGLVLQRLSTTYQSMPKVLQQAVQHCRILLSEESHDVVLASGGDIVDFAVAVLKAASLGLEGFEFRDAETSKAGNASGREAIFLECVVEEKRRIVPANERAVDSHQMNICDVVHELEELDLCPRGDSAMNCCIRCNDGMSGCSAVRSQVMSPMTSSALHSLKRIGA